MTDLESRLRSLNMRAPRDLQERILDSASARAAPRPRLLAALVAAILMILLSGYGLLAVRNASPASAAGASGYGFGEGCWFVKDADGLHFHVGGWYEGLPALCTSERRESTPGR